MLVATDIAARGLDIDDIRTSSISTCRTMPESYVHRIGRTGRAGATASRISFCDVDERSVLQAIQRLTRQTLAIEPRPKNLPPAAVEAEPVGAGVGSEPRGDPQNGPSSNAGRLRRQSAVEHRRNSGPTPVGLPDW